MVIDGVKIYINIGHVADDQDLTDPLVVLAGSSIKEFLLKIEGARELGSVVKTNSR